MCKAFLQRSEGILIDGIGNPIDGPHLSVVGMSGKLEVDAVMLRLL